MKTKIIIAGALLGAFLAGTMLAGYLYHGSNPASTTWASAANQKEYSGSSLTDRSDDSRLLDYRRAAPRYRVAPSRLVVDSRSVPTDEEWTESRVHRVAETTAVDSERRPFYRRRTWQREALIIGGSAAAGTVIGAVAGGKKGAAVGALSGAAAGTIYDLATRNKRNRTRSF